MSPKASGSPSERRITSASEGELIFFPSFSRSRRWVRGAANDFCPGAATEIQPASIPPFSHFRRRDTSLRPESGELRRDQLLVSDLPFERADLAGEAADVGDHLLGNGRVVEGSIARHLVRDEARLLGGE